MHIYIILSFLLELPGVIKIEYNIHHNSFTHYLQLQCVYEETTINTTFKDGIGKASEK